MTLKTYYGFLDAYSNVGSVTDNLSNEVYKNFCTFMGHLTASNVASLIAWNSGANSISGSFNQRGYWDEGRTFGQGAHSVWRFNTSSTRNWEWYLYAQLVSGSSGQIRNTFNIPISGYAAAGDTIAGSTGNRGILVQAALCVSGGSPSSFNPWSGSQGTPSFDGNSTAGTPRWISGSTGQNQLYMLPRSNDTGGPAVCIAQKSNAAVFGEIYTSSEQYNRYSFICDGDSIITVMDGANNGSTAIGYIGPFELRNSLTASGFGGGPYGFAMYTQNVGIAGVMNRGTIFGDAAGTTTTQNGGIAVPLGNMVSGSKSGVPDTIATFPAQAYQPNTVTNQQDEFPIFVGVSENPNFGLLGTLSSGLIRFTFGGQTGDVLSNLSRAVFGGSTTTLEYKVAIPWTGSVAPGIGLSRTGSLHTWTRDYN